MTQRLLSNEKATRVGRIKFKASEKLTNEYFRSLYDNFMT